MSDAGRLVPAHRRAARAPGARARVRRARAAADRGGVGRARATSRPTSCAQAAAVGLTAYADPGRVRRRRTSPLTSALIAEELSWGCAGLAATLQATMFPVRPLLAFGSDEQRSRYLPRIASPEGCLAAIAFTEPGAGSDVAAIEATARREGDELRPRRREVLRHERRDRGRDRRLREARRRDLRVPARARRPRRLRRPQGAQARPARLVHRLDPARGGAHPGRPPARRGRARASRSRWTSSSARGRRSPRPRSASRAPRSSTRRRTRASGRPSGSR